MAINSRYKGFVGPSYNLTNYNFDCQRTINRFVEYDEMATGKDSEPAQLTPTPGLTALITGLGNNEYKTSHTGYTASNNKLFWVFGQTLYQIHGVKNSNTGWTTTYIGDIDTDGDVQYCDNGVTLFIVSTTGLVWFVNLNTLELTNSSTDPTWDASNWTVGTYTYSGLLLAPASCCTYQDGYVIFGLKDSNTFFWTDLYSTSITIATEANPSASGGFANAEANPDQITAIISNNEDLWIFGGTTTELWYNSGEGNQVFARRPGILVETGAVSPRSVKKLNNTIFWLSTDARGGPRVFIAKGYVPQRISTFPIESQLGRTTASNIANATADSYQMNGHFLYSLNIPGFDTTFVFDMTGHIQVNLPIWFEKQSNYLSVKPVQTLSAVADQTTPGS